jgi:drug/metabolite transporter (DMT)-like permease
MPNPDMRRLVTGGACGVAAVAIWAGWIIAARLGIKTTLSPWDIAALRFAVAGVILLPALYQKGLALDRLGWRGLVALAVGGGAPMVVLASGGLAFAPASHAGALFPGVVPVMVAFLGSAVLGEQFPLPRKIGLGLIVVGAACIAAGAGATIGGAENIGHVMFVGAAFLWACYTVVMRRAPLDGMHAAALAAVISLFVYVPLFALFGGDKILLAPLGDIALQAFVQGFLTAVVSLILYGRAVNALGASSGAALAALCPAMTALAGVPILGEMPALHDWIAILLICVGVYLVSSNRRPL